MVLSAVTESTSNIMSRDSTSFEIMLSRGNETFSLEAIYFVNWRRVRTTCAQRTPRILETNFRFT